MTAKYNIIVSGSECKCTKFYNWENGKLFKAHCAKWESGDESSWCYLASSEKAAYCPGAKKSTLGELYWSSDADICSGKA